MSETSKPEAWQRGVHIGLHHDIHFLRYAQRRVFADVPVRFCGVLDQIWFPIRGKICLCFTFAICIPNRTGPCEKITELIF